MKTVAIIGAGQLGSRHLQGLKTAKAEMDIWVMDASPESLNVAKERYDVVQSPSSKTIHFVDRLDCLPAQLDLVIIATGSKPRATIVKSLLAHSKVTYLILEKFLFTKLIEYDEIEELLIKENVKCWVNCPRRMWESYSQIKKMIDPSLPVIMEKKGKDWGMCCNSVHYIDIWQYLGGDCAFTVDLSSVEPAVIESKRKGYIELYGEERFTSEKRDELVLASYSEYNGTSCVTIKNGNKIIVFDEATGNWSINEEHYSVKTPFQSILTGQLADEIFETGKCKLSLYAESINYHKPYLKIIMEFVNKLQGIKSDSCPIT